MQMSIKHIICFVSAFACTRAALPPGYKLLCPCDFCKYEKNTAKPGYVTCAHASIVTYSYDHFFT